MVIRKIKLSNNQDGVTLLLSILILASMLAIAFSLATITFVEIRSSGDLIRAETSFYGADAIAEQALYNVKRRVNVANSGQCDSTLPNCYSTSVGNVLISGNGSTSPWENPINDPIQQDVFAPGSVQSGHSFPTAAKHYPFYNPSNPTGGSGYGSVKVTYLSTGNNDSLNIYVCEFDPSGATAYYTAPCSDPLDATSTYWKVNGGVTLTPGTSPMVSYFDSSKQQEMIIFNQNNSENSQPIYVQIEAFAVDNVTPKGIPYFQQGAVDINAQNTTVNRKLRVLIPHS